MEKMQQWKNGLLICLVAVVIVRQGLTGIGWKIVGGHWRFMMNIVRFPTKKPDIHEFKVRLDVEVLEDGSIWYRVENLKTGSYGEWIKMEDDE